MRIDCHTHLPLASKQGNFGKKKSTLLSTMSKNDIDYAVLIPDNIKDSNIGDLDTCLRLIQGQDRLFLVGVINLKKDRKYQINYLDKLFKQEKIKGIKIFPGHDPIYPTDKRLEQFYKLCIKYGFPLMIHTGGGELGKEAVQYNRPEYIVRLARKFPRLKIIICHLFPPNPKYCYELSKDINNIYYDVSALASESIVRKIGEENLKQILEKIIKNRPDRVLFGSDYGCCSMKKHIELVNSLNISKHLKEKIFYQNTLDVFKLDLK